LILEIQRHNDAGYEFRPKYNEELIQQAKKMEKMQIIKTAQDNFYAGQDLVNGYKIDWYSSEQYYNETFKSE
jgi:NADPH-dependent 7-cyano-7-deazaguanine reductase QueF-like protein